PGTHPRHAPWGGATGLAPGHATGSADGPRRATMDPATTAERLVWLPFEAAELADDDAPDHVVPDGLRVERYETGEPPASIGDVRFWSPAYDRKHDWAG